MTSKTCQPGHFENPAGFQEQDFTHFPGLADLRLPPPTHKLESPDTAPGGYLGQVGFCEGGEAPQPAGWLCPNPLLRILLLLFTEHRLHSLLGTRYLAHALKPRCLDSKPDSNYMPLGMLFHFTSLSLGFLIHEVGL